MLTNIPFWNLRPSCHWQCWCHTKDQEPPIGFWSAIYYNSQWSHPAAVRLLSHGANSIPISKGSVHRAPAGLSRAGGWHICVHSVSVERTQTELVQLCGRLGVNRLRCPFTPDYPLICLNERGQIPFHFFFFFLWTGSDPSGSWIKKVTSLFTPACP